MHQYVFGRVQRVRFRIGGRNLSRLDSIGGRGAGRGGCPTAGRWVVSRGGLAFVLMEWASPDGHARIANQRAASSERIYAAG